VDTHFEKTASRHPFPATCRICSVVAVAEPNRTISMQSITTQNGRKAAQSVSFHCCTRFWPRSCYYDTAVLNRTQCSARIEESQRR
jgi:hypothetical protein